MSGAGNDFIALPEPAEPPTADEVRALCRRSISVGADGVFAINRTEDGVRMIHWNADGGRAELCLNGSRCAAQLAFHLGWAQEAFELETDAGRLQAFAVDEARTQITLPPIVSKPEARTLRVEDTDYSTHFVEVGVPHLVLDSRDLGHPEVATVPVASLSPPLRSHPQLAHGANVNFVETLDPGRINLRTFERGVEAETLACGTGAIASVAVGIQEGRLQAPVRVRTTGGIELEVDGDESRSKILGDARLISRGEILPGAFA